MPLLSSVAATEALSCSFAVRHQTRPFTAVVMEPAAVGCAGQYQFALPAPAAVSRPFV
jgi:hypothetical protein